MEICSWSCATCRSSIIPFLAQNPICMALQRSRKWRGTMRLPDYCMQTNNCSRLSLTKYPYWVRPRTLVKLAKDQFLLPTDKMVLQIEIFIQPKANKIWKLERSHPWFILLLFSHVLLLQGATLESYHSVMYVSLSISLSIPGPPQTPTPKDCLRWSRRTLKNAKCWPKWLLKFQKGPLRSLWPTLSVAHRV